MAGLICVTCIVSDRLGPCHTYFFVKKKKKSCATDFLMTNSIKNHFFFYSFRKQRATESWISSALPLPRCLQQLGLVRLKPRAGNSVQVSLGCQGPKYLSCHFLPLSKASARVEAELEPRHSSTGWSCTKLTWTCQTPSRTNQFQAFFFPGPWWLTPKGK